MRIPFFARSEQAPPAPAEAAPSAEERLHDRPRRRRGVTSLEYVVVASLIIVVVIAAVQQLGFITNGLFTNSADATTKINNGN